MVESLLISIIAIPKILYKTIKQGKERCVLNSFKRDKIKFDLPNEEIVEIYYDIEIHTRVDVGGAKIHTPYIVGFADNLTSKFQYFAVNELVEDPACSVYQEFVKFLQPGTSIKPGYCEDFT